MRRILSISLLIVLTISIFPWEALELCPNKDGHHAQDEMHHGNCTDGMMDDHESGESSEPKDEMQAGFSFQGPSCTTIATMPPMVQPFDPTASKPLMLLTVSSEEKSGKELYDLAYYSLRQMLSGVEGIIAPAAYGGALRRIYIFVDPAKLEARGISQTEVMEAIQRNTTMIPSGIAEIGNINYGIEAQGLIEHVEEFNDIVSFGRKWAPTCNS